METKDEIRSPAPERKPGQYQRPQVRRWGTLRELTQGGGGFKKEPVTKLDTRF